LHQQLFIAIELNFFAVCFTLPKTLFEQILKNLGFSRIAIVVQIAVHLVVTRESCAVLRLHGRPLRENGLGLGRNDLIITRGHGKVHRHAIFCINVLRLAIGWDLVRLGLADLLVRAHHVPGPIS
jgi:hypothetical protein